METMGVPRKSKSKPAKQMLRELRFPMILFAVMAFLIVWDIVEDLAAGTTAFHIVIELLMMLAAVAGTIYFWGRLQTARRLERKLERDLKIAHAETRRWQKEERELLQDLQRAIDKQFTKWDFSSTEKHIALCLLKGMSMKEIAHSRGDFFHAHTL